MFSIEPLHVDDPNNYGDKPQMGILEKHLAGPAGDYNGTPGVDSFSATGDLLQVYGNDGNDQLSLAGNQNLLSGGDGDDRLSVDGAGNDLYGDAGNDSLIALGDSNRLFGGTGNDAYFVDNTGDAVVENPDEGNDAVFSTAHLVLSADVETLVLQGSTDLQGYGNGLNNALYGNAGSNLLDGRGGADYMAGGIGDDVYVVDNPGDAVVENPDEGNDAVFSTAHLVLSADVETLVLQGSTDLQGYGNGLNNALYGNAGSNLLDGRGGADYMAGGIGDDVYVVDNPGDAVVENPDEGNDAVFSTAHLVLSADVETLVLQGSTDLQGYGNGLNNALYGNAGSNLLDGRGGADYMAGGIGDDVYVVDDGGDQVVENANEGNDAVFATLDYALADNVETLVLQGTGDWAGTGNTLTNSIYGSSGGNTLDGGAGADVLTGNAGNDIFVFYAEEANGDVVIDFAGNSGAAGDALQFVGYGTILQGATFTQIVASNQWQIHSGLGGPDEIITFLNGASIDPTDVLFS